jgi:spermidine/putrescine-binding protein
MLTFLTFRKSPREIVNVYGWYGIIDREIFDEFEKKTGIKVIYDVYDNNDTLEAKLLATNSGYDVVFPSFIPYAARQCDMGAYSRLDENLIPNIENIKGCVTDKYKEAGGKIEHLIPIFWGTVGLAYDADVFEKVFPQKKIDSYDILFEPEKISLLSKYGISFPEEYIDIFPQMGVFLSIGNGLGTRQISDIVKYMKQFKKIRKYIKKFSSNTAINDLISGEVCIAICASDNAWRAHVAGMKVGKNIKYTTTKDFGILWTDCVGIPEKAPHKKNAYKFLNYLLDPKIAAKITNCSGILVNVPSAFKMFKKELTDDDQICPLEKEKIFRLMIGTPSVTPEDRNYERAATRAWSKTRMNEFSHVEDIEE